MKNYSKATSYLIFLLVCAFTFQSCEWDSDDDNYVYIDRPKDPAIGIDLAGVNPNEIIEVANRNYFYYTLTPKGYKVVKQQFYLDGKEIYQGDKNFVFIDVPNPDEAVHSLTLVMSFRDESLLGHLGETQGLGMYEGTYNFRVKILPEEQGRLNARQSLQDGKYLKVEWTHPKGIDATGYVVYDNTGIEVIATTDLHSTSFVDKDYAYGHKLYVIEAVMQDKSLPPYREQYYVNYKPITQDNIEIEILDYNRIALSWSNANPYPAKYLIKNSQGDPIIIEKGKNRIELPRTSAFPMIVSPINLYVLPELADNKDYNNYNYARLGVSDPILQKGGGYNQFFDKSNKTLYSLDFGYLRSYDANKNMEQIMNQFYSFDTSTGSQVKVSKSGLVAIADINGTLHVFSNSTLSKEVLTVPNVHSFTFGGDKLLVDLFLPASDEESIKIYNTTTMTPMVIDNLSDYWDYYSISLSPDGKHIVAINNFSEVKIFQLENNALVEIYSERKGMYRMTFNEFNANEIILMVENSFEVFDFSTQEVKYRQEGTFCNIDPVTGNLLYLKKYGSNPLEFTVMNSSYTNALATLNLSHLGNADAQLLNNILVYNNYYIDYRKLQNK